MAELRIDGASGIEFFSREREKKTCAASHFVWNEIRARLSMTQLEEHARSVFLSALEHTDEDLEAIRQVGVCFG